MKTLTLIPTPIDDETMLEETARKLLLLKALEPTSLILVEEHKNTRRRWLHWGLPREAIEKFILYNEHTRDELNEKILSELKNGKDAYLMSDCGLPAFCDPGSELVRLCHQRKIKVTSTPFPNSIALAMALSGIPHDRFIFEGFVPKGEGRAEALKRMAKEKSVQILMDTPYRLKKLLTELSEYAPNREAFLALDLNQKTEELYLMPLHSLLLKIDDKSREFILILGT